MGCGARYALLADLEDDFKEEERKVEAKRKVAEQAKAELRAKGHGWKRVSEMVKALSEPVKRTTVVTEDRGIKARDGEPHVIQEQPEEARRLLVPGLPYRGISHKHQWKPRFDTTDRRESDRSSEGQARPSADRHPGPSYGAPSAIS